MRDLVEMAYEASKQAKNKKEQMELFTEMFLGELGKMKGADIAPHLSCVFDVLKQEYVVNLTFPVSFDELYSGKSDVE